MNKSDPLLWDLDETARQLGGIHTATVRRLIKSGDLTSKKVGRRLMVSVASVHRYLDLEQSEAQNDACAGTACEENTTCQESAKETKTEYSSGRTRRTGGRPTKMSAEDRLAEVLGF